MLQHRLTTLALVAAIMFSGGRALAQQNNSLKDDSSSTDIALRAKAFDLLKDLAGQIHTLQSPENRARMGSNIAASLWDQDEKQARALFISVQDEIKTVLQNMGSDEGMDEQTRLVFLHLRADTVERIAKHDPDLALAFLKATEPVQPADQPYGAGDAERALEMRLAKAVAANSPDLALKLGRQTLARGFSEDLLTLFRQLNRKHREQAQIFYKEIVAKLRDADMAGYTEGFYFAHKLALSFAPPVADESAFQELINMLIKGALANGCGAKVSEEDEKAWYCSQIGALLPQMERVDPIRAGRLKQWASSAGESQWSPDAFDELNEVNSSGNIDDMIALAPKYPQMQYDIYFRAVRMAEAAGDFARARKIANDNIGDPERRQYLLAQIERDEKWASMDEARVAEIQQMMNSMPQSRDRIGLLLFTVSRMNGNPRTVLKLLDHASAMVDTMKPGREQTEAQFRLAIMYCSRDSDRGLAIIESMMPKLNELVSASAKLDGYENRYLREGEWNMTSAGAIGDLLTKLSQNAGYFAWRDFDRAVSLSAQFERPELRLMAQLKLAQAILAGRPKRAPVFGGYVTN